MANFKKAREKFSDIIKRFQDEILGIRTGKAHISMVEGILVDSYGSKVPISHVASISTPDAKSILIKPWDKSIMSQIESAIQKSSLGIKPISENQKFEEKEEMEKIVGKINDQIAELAEKKEKEILTV